MNKVIKKSLLFLFFSFVFISCGDEEEPNAAPTISPQTFNASEAITVEDLIGTISAADANGDALTFSISANDNNLFTVTAGDATTTGGRLSLNAGQNLDFETATTHTIMVNVSDGQSAATTAITINVSDIIENTPPVVEAQEFTVTEDISDATIIGTVVAIDAEANNLTYSISTNDNDLFEINFDGGLSLLEGRNLDFETITSHTITVQVSDSNLQTEATITINVTDVDERVLTALVSSFAGTGDYGYSEGRGVNAAFSGPQGIVAIGDGSFLIADRGNNRIRKVDAEANVSTVAGQDTRGYSDGPLGVATFEGLTDMARATDGTIYAVDLGNHAIRKISIDGIVSTFSGGLVPGFDNGDISTATFQSPHDIVIDQDGNLLISDSGNNSIRKINLITNQVTTLAGGGLAGYKDDQGNLARFNRPYGLALDATGNLFVADYSNNRIRKVDPAGNVTSFVGSGVDSFADGMGNEAHFSRPSGIDFDSFGNLFIADTDNDAIRMATPSGKVTTIAGTGVSGAMNGDGAVATFAAPADVAVDAIGNVFVIEAINCLIRKITITRD